jgi:hypothetical protein
VKKSFTANKHLSSSWGRLGEVGKHIIFVRVEPVEVFYIVNRLYGTLTSTSVKRVGGQLHASSWHPANILDPVSDARAMLKKTSHDRDTETTPPNPNASATIKHYHHSTS